MKKIEKLLLKYADEADIITSEEYHKAEAELPSDEFEAAYGINGDKYFRRIPIDKDSLTGITLDKMSGEISTIKLCVVVLAVIAAAGVIFSLVSAVAMASIF